MSYDKITYLEDEIKKQAYNYYSGNQQISDNEFDNLVYELSLLDPDNKVLNSVGFGFFEDDSYETYPHFAEFTGLPKSKVTDDFMFKIDQGDDTLTITPKLDGGSVELIYQDGKLVRALTRGNGKVGRDVTDKLRLAQGVPNELPEGWMEKYTGNVVGEYVLSEEDRVELGLEDSNRNIPNGFLARKEFDENEAKHFSFVAYRVSAVDFDNEDYFPICDMMDYHCTVILMLKDHGFLVPNFVQVESNRESYQYRYLYENLRVINGKTYMIDGLVVNRDLLDWRNEHKVHYLIYADSMAYKTITDTATTKVKGINWRLTRTSKLVPTLQIEPVYLSGATISNVLAHNYQYVKDNNIGLNTEIEIVRSGEVIPYILDVNPQSGKDYDAPTHCPCCGEGLVVDGVDLVCLNEFCCNKSYEDLYRWISVVAPVKGLGSRGISQIIEVTNSSSILDLYSDYAKSQKDDLHKFARLSFDALQSKPRISVTDFLYALNLQGVGYTTISKFVNDKSITSSKIKDGSVIKELESFKINDKIRNNVISKLNKVLSNELLDTVELVDNLVNEPEDNSDKLKVCITGSLSDMTKSEFYTKYADKVVESDVKNCDYLISNSDKMSSKMTKAQKLGKSIITEADFINQHLS